MIPNAHHCLGCRWKLRKNVQSHRHSIRLTLRQHWKDCNGRLNFYRNCYRNRNHLVIYDKPALFPGSDALQIGTSMPDSCVRLCLKPPRPSFETSSVSSDQLRSPLAGCSVRSALNHLHLAAGSSAFLGATVHGRDKSLCALVFPHTQHCGRGTAPYRLNYKVAPWRGARTV